VAIAIKGLSSLEAKLNRLTPMTRDAIVAGVSKAAALVEGSAKTIVPVDTGHLRESINSSTSATGTGAQAEIGTNVEYAAYVELGTSRQAAEPYLHPALQKNKQKAKQLIISEIVKAHRGL
jgi:HK97 gp10 family phage protein